MPRGPESIGARRTFTIILVLGAFLAGGVGVGLITVLAAGFAANTAKDQALAARAESELGLEQALAALEASRAQADELDGSAPQPAEVARVSVEGWFSEALKTMTLEGLRRG